MGTSPLYSFSQIGGLGALRFRAVIGYHSMLRAVGRIDLKSTKALIFDVDGTLYDDRRLWTALRRRVYREFWYRPWRARAVNRNLHHYGAALEELRENGTPAADIELAQVEAACRRGSSSAQQITSDVSRWMDEELLRLLPRFPRHGLAEVLKAAKARGLLLGVLSDYPAEPKLRRLGLLSLFQVVVSARDPEVQLLKPHPRGLQVVLRRLGVSNAEAIYIGDRADIDGRAARAAGMESFIVPSVGTFAELLASL